MNVPLPRFFWGALGLFLLHRWASWLHLAPEFYGNVARSALVGFLSDLWISWILTLAVLAASKVWKGLWFASLLALLVGLSGHQAYVGYFKSQILPFHLTYLFEWVFLRSQITSLWDRDVILFFSMGLVWILAIPYLSRKTKIGLKGIVLGSLVTLGAHVLHIRYKIQWFVHENLQSNVVENLVVKFLKEPFVEGLTESELLTLSADYGLSFSPSAFTKPGKPAMDREVQVIKQAWDRSVGQGHKPIFLFVLMEGQREVDRKSFQPHFSQLGARGLLFEAMTSTGTVTRGGQEAVLCGYPGSVMSSTMRNHPEIKLKCLPSLTAETSFWIHGGMGLFDAQKVFWEGQGVRWRYSMEDFAAELPMTPWGISDFSLMVLAENKLNSIVRESQSYSLGMILTMSNHIPWVLPSDSPAPLRDQLSQVASPSWLTSSYADMALDQLVHELKNEGYWKDTILIAVGDHGHESPSPEDSSKEDKLTRISALISGGLVEASVEPQVISTPVSQKDLAYFAAEILGLKLNAPLAQSPFSPRMLPVFADLGDALYFPLSQKTIKIRDIQKKGSRKEPEELFTAWYHRLIQEWSLNLGVPPEDVISVLKD